MAIAADSGMRAGVVVLIAGIGFGCGSGSPQREGETCVPACLGKSCGPDGCGGSCGTCAVNATCQAGACVATGACLPSCAGKVCGDDGCGGSCGTCVSGASCVQGACRAQASPGCPQGGRCTYLERTAWKYDCTAADQCVRASAIATYGTYEACQTFGCMGGNSRCGDQFGNPSDPDRWSCEQCKVTCGDDYGSSTNCPPAQETTEGCALSDSIWGTYLADCICQ